MFSLCVGLVGSIETYSDLLARQRELTEELETASDSERPEIEAELAEVSAKIAAKDEANRVAKERAAARKAKELQKKAEKEVQDQATKPATSPAAEEPPNQPESDEADVETTLLTEDEMALVARLEKRIGAIEVKVDKGKWESAKKKVKSLSSEVAALPKHAGEYVRVQELISRRDRVRARIKMFDARLFDELFQQVMVADFIEPKGLSPMKAAEWERKEEDRRVKKIAKSHGVSKKYADQVFIEGDAVKRWKEHGDEEWRKQVAQERADTAALLKQCGESVATGLTGPVPVNLYLESKLHDPNSKKDQRCVGPWLTKNCWVGNCTFRAKNAMGAYVQNTWKFWIEKNKVVRAEQVQ
jgi:hypothetical protein